MGEFKVNIPNTRSAAGTLSQLQKQLLQNQDKIIGVKNGLSSSSMAAVRISLGYQAEHVGSEAGKLLNMYQKLEEICQLYVNSEEQIKSGKPSQEGMDFGGGSGSTGGNTSGQITAGLLAGLISEVIFKMPPMTEYIPFLPHLAAIGKLAFGLLNHTNSNSGLAWDGSLLSGSVLGKLSGTWKPEKGEISAGAEASASGHVAQGSVSGSIGLFSGKVEGAVGNAAVSGTLGASLMKDGKFSPNISAGVKGEVSAVSGKIGTQFGTENFNHHMQASGKLLAAEAEAKAAAGKITWKDEATGQEVSGWGAEASAGAEAYVAQGSVSGGFTLFGVKIDASLSGKAGGVGAKAGGRVHTGGASGEIGLGLGVGLGLKVNIDWSNFSLW